MKPGKYEDGPASLELLPFKGVSNPQGVYELKSLHVPKDLRRMGYATAIMWKTVRAADRNLKILMLKCEPYDEGEMTSEDLASWYGRFGFRELPGTPGVMVRMPYWDEKEPEKSPIAQCLTS